jgi:hypothetical protein
MACWSDRPVPLFNPQPALPPTLPGLVQLDDPLPEPEPLFDPEPEFEPLPLPLPLVLPPLEPVPPPVAWLTAEFGLTPVAQSI